MLNVLDGLHNLKTLEYEYYTSFANDSPTIYLAALETLKLGVLDKDNCVRVLRAITCNGLRSLSIFGGFIDIPDDVIYQICSFQTLALLKLDWLTVSEDQLETLGRRLPHNTEFEMRIMENVDHKP